MLAGTAEAAGAPLGDAEGLDHVEVRLHHRNDDQLR